MSNLDVSLRLSLINQMRAGAEAAKRDLDKIRAAADRTSKAQSAGTIRAAQAAQQLERAEMRKAAAVARTSVAYRRQRSEMLAGSMAAEHIARRQEVRQAREAARVRRDARSAQVALAAAASAGRKIEWGPAPDIKLNPRTARSGGGGTVPAAAYFAAERARRAAEAEADSEQAGKKRRGGKGGKGGNGANPALAAGAGAGFARTFAGGLAAGIGAAGLAEAIKRAVAGAAADEYERSQLMVSGNLSPAQMEAHRKLLERTGRRRGIGSQAAYGAFGGLMDAGFSDTEAAAMTDNLVVFAKANRVATEEATSLTAALKMNLKIATSAEMMAAYDILSRRGSKASMSPADLANYLPSSLAKANRLGEQGLTGLRNTVALLQGVRRGVGDSREAFSSFEAMVDQISNPAFIKRAAKFGINIEKTIRDANKKGVSPLLAVLRELDRKTKGDPIKLGKLGLNKNAIAAVVALLKDIPGVLEEIDGMAESGGATMKKYAEATNNATEAWDRLFSHVSGNAKNMAATALPLATWVMNKISEANEERQKQSDNWKERWRQKVLEDNAAQDADKRAHLREKREAARKKADEDLRRRIEPYVPAGRDFTDIADPEPQQEAIPRADDGTPMPTRARRDGFADDGTPMPTPAPRDWLQIQDMLKAMDAQAKEAALSTMDAYKQAMGTGLEQTRTIVASAVAEMRAMLNFTATPTISPRVVTAAPAGGGGGAGNSVTVTQNISSPNSRVAAARAKREYNREVRMAMADPLHDMGLA